ncbi:short-chain dehydrogenase/reductase 2b isoform X2 [Humulus lupulus]|uniref:short-chain dehydrogenase/reductase 2b isoform X2 n=1 Tax=Humulus lupulus TaxID=3486 RepID=UPI002B404F89|nr:short-chain dehydrogenase/reductase 2b isoform X2 [Humulus lupulus]
MESKQAEIISLPSSSSSDLKSSQSPTTTLASRWWSSETVGIVTGGNKGIGYAMVKRLAEMGVSVVLTARDEEKGRKAIEQLRRELGESMDNVHCLCLDVSDPSSIASFVSSFKQHFGVLDILVNNAAVSFNDIGENSVEHAETVIKTNFYGAKLLTEALFPLFRLSSPTTFRLLNISSRLGSINKLRNPGIRKILEKEDVTEEEVEGVVRWFLEDVKSGRWRSRGWPELWTDYAVSKLAMNAYTRILAKRYKGKGLSANCFCPGYTQTSMTRGKGTHTADDAALVGTKLALLPPPELPTGKFFIIGAHNTSVIIHARL